MKKCKRFHQFVITEKGNANTAIIDFLKGDLFQVENDVLDKFEKGQFEEISEFVASLEEEGLVLDLEEGTWVPGMSLELDIEEDTAISLELEEGVDLDLVREKLGGMKIAKIQFYGDNAPETILPFVEVVQKEKNFDECVESTTVDGDFAEIDEFFYSFNKEFNSCWGQKLAVTKDGKMRPCIYSTIELGDLKTDPAADVIKKLSEEHWKITKDKVEKCKDCELRYACFDCREIAYRAGGDLNAPFPNCKYDPYKGGWSE